MSSADGFVLLRFFSSVLFFPDIFRWISDFSEGYQRKKKVQMCPRFSSQSTTQSNPREETIYGFKLNQRPLLSACRFAHGLQRSASRPGVLRHATPPAPAQMRRAMALEMAPPLALALPLTIREATETDVDAVCICNARNVASCTVSHRMQRAHPRPGVLRHTTPLAPAHTPYLASYCWRFRAASSSARAFSLPRMQP